LEFLLISPITDTAHC